MEEAALEERIESKENAGREHNGHRDDADYNADLEPSQRGEYSTEGEAEYKSIIQKQNLKTTKGESKKSREKAGNLEEKLGESNGFSVMVNEDGKIFLAYQGHRVYGEGAVMPAKFLFEDGDADEKGKAAVTIIYNPQTGEFLLEEKTGTYPIRSEAGKFAMIGGHKKLKDFSTFETADRELGEEIEEPAQSVFRRTLGTRGKYFGTMVEIFNGLKYETDVWEIPVGIEEWEIGRKARPRHDAGPFHVLTLDEILSKPNSQFAFDHGAKLKEFIYTNYSLFYAQTNNTFHFMQSSNMNASFANTSSHANNVTVRYA